jgi:DnaA family protein
LSDFKLSGPKLRDKFGGRHAPRTGVPVGILPKNALDPSIVHSRTHNLVLGVAGGARSRARDAGKRRRRAPMKQLALGLPPLSPPTFDNFVVGRNEEVVEALRALARPDARERFIYLWGPPGCGKSHLLDAAVCACAAQGRVLALVQHGQALPVPDDDLAARGVAVDDVNLLEPDEQSELFTLYNVVRERGGVLLAAGGGPPATLAMREDLLTRLGWGLVYQVYPLSDEEKAAALIEYARARGMPMPDEVVGYLLARENRDLRHLTALLDALDRYSLETRRQVTVPLVRELLAGGTR